jgi:radical SAM family uncharacterized protein
MGVVVESFTHEGNSISARLEWLLPTVSRPARYTGGEWNARIADWPAARLRIALAYPDLYEVGMANLGLAILYNRLNRIPGVLAERVYAPWADMDAALRQAGLPLYSLETLHPLAEFDIVGFSLPYELTYTNILSMLDLAGLPLLAAERGDAHPVVLGGGSGAYNPEPLAAFFDLFVVGEGEEAMDDLVRCWLEVRAAGGGKEAFLCRAAAVRGVYVPHLYQVSYHDDGTVDAIVPQHPDIPRQVHKRVVADLSASPIVTRPVVPYVDSVHDRAVIEIQRGCTRGCRFCQAGMVYRPVRERSPDEVRAAARELLAHTGYEELSLLSFSSSDYSRIEELLRGLVEDHREVGLTLSLPSQRLDAFSVTLAELIAQRRRTGLTFAPEAGTQRLRDVINKGLNAGDFVSTLEAAFGHGWHRVKLYFVVGLPTETEADLQGLVDMVREALRIGRQHAGRRATVAVSVAPLVPKAHTPFQWAAQASPEALDDKLRFLRRGLRGSPGIEFSWHDPAGSCLEAALARGDRRVADVIRTAWRNGARFDAWEEHFQPDVWWAAFAAAGLDPAFYANRARPRDEVLPWNHISCGVSKAFLWQEYRRALRGETTPDCREGDCSGCGVRRLAACAERK